jgi:hypothetical protein
MRSPYSIYNTYYQHVVEAIYSRRSLSIPTFSLPPSFLSMNPNPVFVPQRNRTSQFKEIPAVQSLSRRIHPLVHFGMPTKELFDIVQVSTLEHVYVFPTLAPSNMACNMGLPVIQLIPG